MAKSILTGVPLSHNDLRIIVHIVEQSFDHYLNRSAFPEYRQALRTLVGLGYTAAFVDEHLLGIYQGYLTEFLNEGQDKTQRLAQSFGQMIHIASLCFYTLGFPRYYQDFIAALSMILKIPGFGEQKEVERILNCF